MRVIKGTLTVQGNDTYILCRSYKIVNGARVTTNEFKVYLLGGNLKTKGELYDKQRYV